MNGLWLVALATVVGVAVAAAWAVTDRHRRQNEEAAPCDR